MQRVIQLIESLECAEKDTMNKRTLIIVAGVIGLIAVIGAGWYLGSPLFIDETVDETFPFEAPDEAIIAAMPEAEREELEKQFMAAMPDMEAIENLSPEELEAVADEVMNTAAVVMMDKPVADDMMADVDLSAYQGVVIYCVPFHVVFATATLGS